MGIEADGLLESREGLAVVLEFEEGLAAVEVVKGLVRAGFGKSNGRDEKY
jgi:hypothetical protein